MKLLYINTENLYPHDLHLIDGLRKNNHDVIEIIREKKDTYFSLAKKIRKQSISANAVIVGFTSPLLVIVARLATTKRIIFNAASSQYEANIISRNTENKKRIIHMKWWLVDFLSFHLSNKVLLESRSQVDFVSKLFLISKNKLVVSFSGVNENDFYYIPGIKKKDVFTVLFRGRFLPESGILTVIESAKKLENEKVNFLVIGHGFLYREVNALIDKLKPKNMVMINERIEIDKLRKMMLECHVCLGQLADHPRLDRTLPCKLFESLALKLPYLTGRNKAALEILEDNVTCITVNPGDCDDLAMKIRELMVNREVLDRVAEAGYKLYRQELTSEILAKKVLASCLK